MNLELLRTLSFWTLVVGLAMEVAVAIVAFVITHNEISREREETLKHWLEAFAVFAGTLVLLAIIGEHNVGKMDAKEKREASVKIAALEKAQKEVERQINPEPKPLDERLRIFLSGFDKSLLQKLKTGPAHVQAYLTGSQHDELDRLFSERGSEHFITRLPQELNIQGNRLDGSVVYGATFLVSTNLLGTH